MSIVIPAFDEVAVVAATVTSVCDHLRRRGLEFEVIVSVDGTDGTRAVAERLAAEEPRITVLGGTGRRGKGRSVREGVALSSGAIVGFVDADGKTPIAELDRVLPRFELGHDVVIGSRSTPGSRFGPGPRWYRRLGSRAFAVVVHLMIGLGDVPDTQCGFKFMTREAALALFARQRIDGYMFDVELLHLARRSGLSIDQVAVRWRSDDDSRSRLVTGTIVHALDLVRIRLRRD